MSNESQKNSPPSPRLERLPEVSARTGRSRPTIYRDIANGSFPKPVKIGARAIAFLACEVDAWIAARADLRETEPMRRSQNATA